MQYLRCLCPPAPGSKTSISANADGPLNAASRKIGQIALPTEYNYQTTSVGQ